MPSWPIEMPSDTEIVPNSIGNPSAPRTPILAFFASRFERQVARGDLVPAATRRRSAACASRRRPCRRPAACPRAAARSIPSVTIALCGLRCLRGGSLVTAATLRASVVLHVRGRRRAVADGPRGTRAPFRLPWLAYLAVVLLRSACCRSRWPAMLATGRRASIFGPRAVLLLIPVAGGGVHRQDRDGRRRGRGVRARGRSARALLRWARRARAWRSTADRSTRCSPTARCGCRACTCPTWPRCRWRAAGGCRRCAEPTPKSAAGTAPPLSGDSCIDARLGQRYRARTFCSGSPRR